MNIAMHLQNGCCFTNDVLRYIFLWPLRNEVFHECNWALIREPYDLPERWNPFRKMDSQQSLWLITSFFVMTEGTLYISHDTEDFEVNPESISFFLIRKPPATFRLPAITLFLLLDAFSFTRAALYAAAGRWNSVIVRPPFWMTILIPVHGVLPKQKQLCPDETAAGFCSQQFSIHGSHKLWNDHYSLFPWMPSFKLPI